MWLICIVTMVERLSTRIFASAGEYVAQPQLLEQMCSLRFSTAFARQSVYIGPTVKQHLVSFLPMLAGPVWSIPCAEDWAAPVQESCAKLNATCPCGANAKPCKWTDDWGYEED